jgi:hypothetical protein
MWVFMNNAFLSIVADRNDQDCLLVRARFAKDIKAVFPEAEVMETPDADYRFRALLPRTFVSARLAYAVNQIDYPNFKGSVLQNWRHDLYMKVWQIMFKAQNCKI